MLTRSGLKFMCHCL